MLERERTEAAAVTGYDWIEATHLSVAAAVASGQADVGFGIEAAAAQFSLDFIPLMREQYYFACLKETLDQPAMMRLRELLRHSQWRDAIADLHGYDASGAGAVVALRQAMPWYAFRTAKPGPAGNR
jgi:putative molybdopterin biosynthesis protein